MAYVAHLMRLILAFVLLLDQFSDAFTALVNRRMRARGHISRLFSSNDGKRYYGISRTVKGTKGQMQIENSSEHTHFMRLALRLAQHAFREKEVPIGALIADPSGKIIATGRNQVEKYQDPTVFSWLPLILNVIVILPPQFSNHFLHTVWNLKAHAEMICLRQAAEIQKTWRLRGHKLYTTLEPCPMCMGALQQARIDTVVYAAKDLRLGAAGSYVNLVDGAHKHPFHGVRVEGGILEEESSSLIRRFFLLRRREGFEIQGGKIFGDRGYQFRGSFDEWEK